MQVQHAQIWAASLACLFFTGCDGGSVMRGSPTSPSLVATSVPIPQPAPPSYVAPTNSVQEIAVGDRVEGRYTYCFSAPVCTYQDGEKHFVFTAPADGTVLVTLTWRPTVAIFRLTLDGVVLPPRPGIWSPVTGELRVIAGRRYTIVVDLGGADELFENHPFVLSTEMQ